MKKSIAVKVTTFYVVTFIFTILLAIAQEVLKIDYKYVTLPQWGPGIAALILGFALYNNTLDSSIKFSGLHPSKLLVCLLLPFGMISAGYLISKILGLTSVNIVKVDIQLLYIVIPSCFFGAVGEALGWRCFLQKSLDSKFNYLTASILVGILWGLWHVGHYSNGLVFMASFLIFTISSSIVLSCLIRKFNYNILLAALFHLSANVGFFVFYRENTTDANMMLANALVWLIGSVVIVLGGYKSGYTNGYTKV